MMSRSYIRLSGQILEPIFEVFRPKAYYFHDYLLSLHSVMNPQAVNLAYDVLAPNIFMENGKLLGLKIYPTKQA